MNRNNLFILAPSNQVYELRSARELRAGAFVNSGIRRPSAPPSSYPVGDENGHNDQEVGVEGVASGLVDQVRVPIPSQK